MSRLLQDLAAAFPPADRATWRQLVDTALKGRRFEDALVRRTTEGLELQPLYDKADRPAGTDEERPGTGSFVRGWPQAGTTDAPRRGWTRGVAIAHPDAATANVQLLADLEGGAERARVRVRSASQVLANAAAAPQTVAESGRGGVWIHDVTDVETLLNGVMWSMAPITLLAPADGTLDAWLFDTCAQLRGTGGHGLSTQVDIVGRALDGKSGNEGSWLPDPELIAGEVTRAAEEGVSPLDARPLLISTARLRLAGADVVQELAAALATFVAAARALESSNVDAGALLRACEFELVAGSDFFTEIAKLRAFRRAFALVLDTLGLRDRAAAVLVSAVTAEESLTRRDVHVNLLRTTAQAAAAVFGGADSLTVETFDNRLHGGSRLGRRLARNIQALLAEESDAGAVTDPGGGSFYLEHRTEQLAEAAWTQFVEWERAGGFSAICADGSLAAAVDARWQARRKAMCSRREPVLGVSVFPNANEATPDADTFDAAAFVAKWSSRLGSSTTAASATAPSTTPIAHYAGEDFEALRDRAEALTRRTGQPPTVSALVVGTLASYTARLDWVRDLFLAGGQQVAVHTSDEVPTAEWCDAHAAPVTVLIAADEAHDALVSTAAPALAGAGARHIVLAGKPGPQEAAYRDAGVTDFVHVGIDTCRFLARILDTLEASHAAA